MTNSNTTVLMPVHGRAPYLIFTIESVLAQTKNDFEFLIVLDRPDSETVTIIENFKQMDSRIRSLYSPSPGISAALNHGLANSKSLFIARIDSDDVMESVRLKIQEEILQDESIICVGSQLRIMDHSGTTVRYTHYPTTAHSIKASLRIRNVVAHPSVMYRRSEALGVGGYNSKFDGAEDYDLWIRLSRIGKVVNVDKPLTNYRLHQNQSSIRNKDIQVALDARVRKWNFHKSIEKPGLLSALYINRAINSAGICRFILAGIAWFMNPVTFTKFLIWQYIPEVSKSDC